VATKKTQAQEPAIKWAVVLLVAVLGLMVVAEFAPQIYELPSATSGLDASKSN